MVRWDVGGFGFAKLHKSGEHLVRFRQFLQQPMPNLFFLKELSSRLEIPKRLLLCRLETLDCFDDLLVVLYSW